MKFVAYVDGGEIIVGRLADDGVVEPVAPLHAFWREPFELASRGTTIEGSRPTGFRLADLEQRPPVPRDAKVVAIGLNYRRHAVETNMPIPEVPVVFGRWASTLAVDGQPVPVSDEKFDWEGELGVVVGRKLAKANKQTAADAVFGYFAFNDLSGRTFQMQSSQWTLGKNSDFSGPMSPIVTTDATGDPANGLRLTTEVNGELMQDSSTDDMIFDVPSLLSHISQAMTLNPGDIVVTGTPSGVGLASGRFLKAGDTVSVTIERIGTVTTPIVAAVAPDA